MSEKPTRLPYEEQAKLIDQAREDMLVDHMVDAAHRDEAEEEVELLSRGRRRVVGRRVAERAENAERISYEDVQTDLPNERWFLKHLAEAEALGRRYDLPVHVLIMDVAGLKRFNDEHGYSTGNELLSSVGRAMGVVSRKEESFAHRSGDEFGAVIFDGNPKELIKRLRKELKKPTYAVEGWEPQLYFGLATLESGETIGQTRVRAEQAQKQDKQDRRAELTAGLKS